MKISQIYNLKKTQRELDFVDIDPDKDIPLFLDPYFIGQQNSRFSINASHTIQSFFQTFISHLKNGRKEKAYDLFSYLGEPNETCLGLSKGKPSGRGIGRGNSEKIYKSLLKSKAIKSGILEHLEDIRLFVNDVDKDKISDMTTDIIRHHLIKYTISQCRLWSIPMETNIPTGFYWDKKTSQWLNSFADMLIINDKKILLVPKSIVSFSKRYTADTYYQHFILDFLQNEHLSMGSTLVQTRRSRNGKTTQFVTKKSLKENYPFSKDYLVTFTEKHPDVFLDFRENAKHRSQPNYENEIENAGSLKSIIDHLKKQLNTLQSGTQNATKYHQLVVSIFELVMHPHLTCPNVEANIHQGRKRIDITYDNNASEGIFIRLQNKFKLPCPYIMVECKNYSVDIKNPELDQIRGRFSPNRGQVGFITCRTIDDRKLILQKCNDTYKDQAGLIIPLDDNDLKEFLDLFHSKGFESVDQKLSELVRKITLP